MEVRYLFVTNSLPPTAKDTLRMLSIAKRLSGALLALLGGAVTGVGLWFAVTLGSSGTATFTATPRTAAPVVLPPTILNRVATDVVISARGSAGSQIWVGLADPADAEAVLGKTARLAATTVDVSEGRLLTVESGTGPAPDLSAADLWRHQDSAKLANSMTISQAQAPETLIIRATTGTLDSVTVEFTNKTWFVEAVVLTLVGLFLALAGALLLWPTRRTAEAPVVADPAESPSAEATR